MNPSQPHGRTLQRWTSWVQPIDVKRFKVFYSWHGFCVLTFFYFYNVFFIFNKNSAVDEMGDRLATIDMGRKEGAAVPISGGGAGFPSNTMWPGPSSTSALSGILTHPAVWPQYTRGEKWG